MADGKTNIWKVMFFAVIAVIFLSVLILFFLLSDSNENSDKENITTEDNENFNEYFSVQLTRQQLNRLLNEQIDEENVKVDFGENISQVTTSFEFMGRSIEAVMELEPEALDDGNIVLHQRNVSLGNFSLPGSEVLALMDAQADLPEYVNVQPDNNRILINLDELDIGDNGYYIQAETFKLADDDIVFNVGK
ncbi:YpmS family protein [Salibacterium salarium]|uniref:YpmS family protein n=1 Tax=Salibacterium salarium TaxID=284579 RepID=UPI0027D8737F|nr:YpmS family protein [Salibacterium salarium]